MKTIDEICDNPILENFTAALMISTFIFFCLGFILFFIGTITAYWDVGHWSLIHPDFFEEGANLKYNDIIAMGVLFLAWGGAAMFSLIYFFYLLKHQIIGLPFFLVCFLAFILIPLHGFQVIEIRDLLDLVFANNSLKL